MIKVKNLYISYHNKEVVSDINFSFDPGSIVGIIGPNGAGKSTMIKGILGIIPIDKGEVSINDIVLNNRRSNLAYVPQKNDLDWDFPINVFDAVLMGTYPNLGLFKRPKEKEKKLVWDALKRVDMLDYSSRQIGELSGGQQQRVFLARALAQKSDIFFLDEPFTGIDMSSEEKIIRLLKELKDEGKTIFIVNHDLSKTEEYFDHLILMNRHLIDAGKVKDVFIYEKISAAYGSNFIIPDFRREN